MINNTILNNMLILTDDLFLGKGTKRQCFAHPEIPGLCIKISSKKGERSAKREIRYLKTISRRGKSLEKIANFMNETQTNLGKGALFELVRDYDGNISKNFGYYLRLGDSDTTAKIIDAIEDLRSYLLREYILFSDLNSTNILAKKENEHDFNLIIIDGIGDNNQIAFLEYCKPLGIKRCTRKWNAFKNSIAKDFPDVAKKINPFVS